MAAPLSHSNVIN